MSVGSVLIGLQASRKDGRGVTSAEFLEPLGLQPGEVEGTSADGGPWTSGAIYVAIVRFSAFASVDNSIDAGAQSEAFFAGVVEAFRSAARFLDRKSPSITAKMRSTGLTLRVFIDVRMDQDQMELEFPAVLMSACGRHELGIYLISNDIPAAEVLAARE